jgi:hypothetical protein
MKLIFFLVAFCLLSIRVYFSWSGRDRERRGESVSDMVIKSDNFYEEIKYAGRFRLTDDETAFKSISPGGYFKFRKNEESIKAESNLQGTIEYTIYDGKNNLGMDVEGKRLVAEAIREMVAWGFDAPARVERIYRNGGSRALLNEIDSIKSDPVKILYMERLFAVDSLSTEEWTAIANKTGSLGSDVDKARFLNKFPAALLVNPSIASSWFAALGKLGSDMDKANSLHHVLEQDTVARDHAGKILILTASLGSDVDKATLYRTMIDKGLVNGNIFDSLLEQVSHLGSDMDKFNLYKELLKEKNITENQWISLINHSAQPGSDMDEANLLVEIALKMPKTETMKSAYLKAARSIHNDSDYGRAVRAVDY